MIEREKKFLVIAPPKVDYKLWNCEDGLEITQSYLKNDREEERVRKIYSRKFKSTRYFHTIKKDTNIPEEREEIEREITEEEYRKLYQKKIFGLRKLRIKEKGWEIDVYDNINIIVAEYEYKEGEIIPDFPFPECEIMDITGNRRFKNKYLAKRFGS